MQTDKNALRAQMKALRAQAEDRPSRDVLLAENLFALAQVRAAKSVFLYNSFGAEADTSRILLRLLAEGKRVLFPRVDGRDMVAVPYGGGWRKGAFGIEEPLGERAEEEAELCVLPLLAADEQFHRLGYGGGFYDRYLSRPETEGMFRVGLCYDFQLLPHIVSEAHDVLLDAIVTDRRVLVRGGER